VVCAELHIGKHRVMPCREAGYDAVRSVCLPTTGYWLIAQS
jgi:hypothetical protein